MKTSAPAPHGYTDKPERACFYSILSPAFRLPGSDSLVEVAGFTGSQALKWSNRDFVPEIGERVFIRMNGFGAGTVVAYFTEAGWLGVEVVVDERPEWHVKANKDTHPNPLVFGAEIRPL